MAQVRYDPTQFERQRRLRQQNQRRQGAPVRCPECGNPHDLVIVSDGWECWTCDAFIPRERASER